MVHSNILICKGLLPEPCTPFQSLSLRLIECALHNVLLEHGELPLVLSFDVHLDLGYLPDTQGCPGLLYGTRS